ncbi:MAG: CBS domain-containing protein [Anaerolineales bacterium]|jgi:CBS domain-containing protein
MVDKKIIKDWMKKDVFTIHQDASVKEAAAMMLEKRVGTLPVLDEDGILVGITTIHNILECFLPDFVAMLTNVDFIKDYGALKNPSTSSLVEVGKIPVTEFMEKPVSVEADSGLMRALSVLHKHNLTDLPVTQDGKLVGIASRVDIGSGFLASWQNKE